MGWADAPEVSGQAAWMNAPEVGEAAPAKPGLLQRVKNAVYVPENQREDGSLQDAVIGGVTGIPGQIASDFMASAHQLGHDTAPENVANPDNGGGVLNPVHQAGDVLGMAMSPITGTLTSLVGRPVEQQTGIKRNIVGDALSAAIPLGGEAKAADAIEGVEGAAKAASSIHPVAAEAHAAGYVLPPKMISAKPGIVANTLAGVSGKIKTAQAAAEKNQTVTNAIAAKEFGLPPDTQLLEPVFEKIRADAGQAYEAVKSAIPAISADPQYLETVKGLGGANSDAAAHFPNTMKNQGVSDLSDELASVTQFPTSAGMELVKELRSSAVANLNAIGDRSKHMLGLAQRQAADAVDGLIERNIETQGGDTGLVKKYQEARQTIAKSYDVEGATNDATGDVNAVGLGRLASKGKPLTGGLKTIAKVAQAFPSAMKVGVVSEPVSALDFFGAAALAAHGNPKMAGMILARPIARATVLSKPAQNALVNGGATGLPLNELRKAPAVNALYQAGNQPQQ